MSETEELIRKFTQIRAGILGYLRVLVRDPHLAEDLFQETCLIVLRKIDSFDRSGDFSAWVRGIALNLARNALRKERYLHLMPAPELAEAIERTHTAGSLEEMSETATRLDYLDHCMERIDARQRSLLQMRYQKGASLQDIAAKSGRTAGAVQVALSRIRQFLLKCMEQQKAQVSHG